MSQAGWTQTSANLEALSPLSCHVIPELLSVWESQYRLQINKIGDKVKKLESRFMSLLRTSSEVSLKQSLGCDAFLQPYWMEKFSF